MISTAIVLAGGLGTRLKGALKGLPKPMAPIRDRPFLEYQMDFWIDQGISRFILSPTNSIILIIILLFSFYFCPFRSNVSP